MHFKFEKYYRIRQPNEIYKYSMLLFPLNGWKSTEVIPTFKYHYAFLNEINIAEIGNRMKYKSFNGVLSDISAFISFEWTKMDRTYIKIELVRFFFGFQYGQ